MQYGQIYKIVEKENTDNIIYIGSTTGELKTRWIKHLHEAKKRKTPFYKELNNNVHLYEIQCICN